MALSKSVNRRLVTIEFDDAGAFRAASIIRVVEIQEDGEPVATRRLHDTLTLGQLKTLVAPL
jgi:hypothetical protein